MTGKVAAKSLPATVTHAGFQGTAQAFQGAGSGSQLSPLLAIVVIYLVLGILYERFHHPDHDLPPCRSLAERSSPC